MVREFNPHNPFYPDFAITSCLVSSKKSSWIYNWVSNLGNSLLFAIIRRTEVCVLLVFSGEKVIVQMTLACGSNYKYCTGFKGI